MICLVYDCTVGETADVLFFVECYDGWCSTVCKTTRACDRTLFLTSSYKTVQERYANEYGEGVVPNKNTIKRIIDQFHLRGALPLPRNHPSR